MSILNRPPASTPSIEPGPGSGCVHELFMEQAARGPDDVALVDGSMHSSYAELDALTNQMARHLQTVGVGPEKVVGCYLQNPAQMVVHILAILKAGGSYLLIDRQLPDARLLYMVTEAEPALIVHDTALPMLVGAAARATITVHQLAAETADHCTAPVQSGVQPYNSAYLAYTSGSTGRPKGVVITHRATVAHAQAFAGLFHLTRADRVPLMAPAAFDLATEEIIPPLLAGCRLLASTSAHCDLAEFTAEVVERRYTILNIPAPLWKLWTEYLRDHELAVPPGVRLLITGSDKLYTRTFHEWMCRPGAQAVQWVAAYGTTETTVSSSFYLNAATDDLSNEPLIPIGKPIAGTQFYIVDETGRVVPDGTVGELMIGGLGLARGYLKQPEKTDQRFVSDRLSGRAGERLYKTGDLARRRPDGNVVCLGRRDSQVKLNGLRIELGEIEAVLGEHPDVSEAVVVLGPATDGEYQQQLVAYVVSRTGHALDWADLTEHARAQVHPLMIPGRFELLESMPVNANGKLDRARLQSRAGSYV